MKIIFSVLPLIICGFISLHSAAQKNKEAATNEKKLYTNASKMNFYAASIKVQRSFISYFGETAENNWSMVGKDFLNRFHSNGLLTHALFTKNGRLIYVITYGTEKNLPVDVRKIVKSEYYDYAITMAIEVKENNCDIWNVKLDNASEQITVRIENGEMEKVQQFQKLD